MPPVPARRRFVQGLAAGALAAALAAGRGQALGAPPAGVAAPIAAKATVSQEASVIAAVWDDGAPIAAGQDAAQVLQAALDAVSSEGGSVLVKEGRYELARPVLLRSGVGLVGASWGTVFLPKLNSAFATDRPGTADVLLARFAIDGSGQEAEPGAYAKGVYVLQEHGCARLRVEDLRVVRTHHSGIGVDNVHDFIVTRCLLEGCSRVQDGNGIGIGGPSTDGVVAHNVVRGTVRARNFGYGIILEELSPGERLERIAIEGNVCEGNQRCGIGAMGSRDVGVAGNVCQGNAEHGIHLWTKGGSYDTLEDIAVTGNVCAGNGGDGILVEELPAARVLVQGNACEGNRRGIAHRGRQSSLLGNTCARNGLHGLHVLGARDTLVEGNACVDNSRATPGVGDGIAIEGATETFACGNMCYDSAGSASARRQRYGISTLGTGTDETFLLQNYVRRNRAGLRPTTVGRVVAQGNIT